MDSPIVCTLSASELRERQDTILASIRNKVLTRTVIAGGYRFEFSGEAALEEVRRMVELERQCCRFLNFAVSEGEPVFCLDVTGPAEAGAVIGELFR